ncbi:hypothetical protein MTYP_02333 [Methylophilaceae bacterium]|nr:hypothetical protein MTYP_02333 [Methylophilaceae bacterium]
MKKIIDFFKHKITGFRAFTAVIRENRMVTLLLAGLLFAITTIASNLIGKATGYLFPQLDDSAAIIENQNKQFDAVKANLQKLQSAISGQDRQYLSSAIEAIRNIKDDSEQLSVRLAALQEENRTLKQALKSEKGVYGGVDLMLADKAGFKIDSQASYAHHISGNGTYINLTSLNETDNVRSKYLRPGEGVYFTNDKNERCSLTLNNITQVQSSRTGIANFNIACKKG